MNGNASLTDSAGFLMESDYGSPECIIQGEFQIDTLGVSELTGGVLKAGGLTQSTESAYHSLKIDEDFHLVLKGSQKQRLDLPHVKTIPYLDISQSAGVTLVQSFKGTRLDGIEKIENTETFTSQFEENTVQGNGTLNCNLVCKGHLSVDQYKLKINGSFEQNDDVCINNGILEVTGNYLAKEGKLEICGGKTHIHGNTRIKHNAALGMYPKSTEEDGVCPEESYFLSEGNFTTASNNIGTTMTAGTLEVKGNLTQSDSALSYAMNLTGTRLVLSGDTLQQVKINNLLDAVYLCSIDMTGSAGVSFQCGSLYTGGITGWNTIQNKKLFLYNSRIILQQDETYSGSLEIAGGYFDCNGHSFHTEGSLIQWKTVTNINHGTLRLNWTTFWKEPASCKCATPMTCCV